MDAADIKDFMDDYLRDLEFRFEVKDGRPVLRVWRLSVSAPLLVLPLSPETPKETA